MRVGSYTVKAALSGFKDKEEKGVVVGLGEDKAVDFKLQLAAMAETVTVTAELPPIDVTRAGTAANISNDVKEALPTISRSLNDIARINPMFVGQGAARGRSGARSMSVAGNSYRYNSIQIDGAVNNDLFGLAGSAGAPGGAAETQPISLDAIQEMQLVVSPYDVRQGGFSGGGINAVTKSGIERLPRHGVLLRPQPELGRQGRHRHEDLDLQGQAGRLQPRRADREEQGVLLRARSTTGASSGRRASRSTARGRRLRPATRAGRSVPARPAEPVRLRRRGRTRRASSRGTTNSNKFFARADFNLATGHQLTVRHNYVDGLNDIGTPSATAYRTPDVLPVRQHDELDGRPAELARSARASTSCA